MHPLFDKLNSFADKLQSAAFGKKYQRMSEFEVPYATLNRRMLAATIDTCILFLTVLPLSYLMTNSLVGYAEFHLSAFMQEWQQALTQQERMVLYQQHFVESGFLRYWWTNSWVQFIGMGIYCVYCWVKWGATPGKWLTRQQLVGAKTGEYLTYRAAIWRYVGYVLASLPLLLGIFWISFDKRAQGWHDKLADSVVIEKRKNKVE